MDLIDRVDAGRWLRTCHAGRSLPAHRGRHSRGSPQSDPCRSWFNSAVYLDIVNPTDEADRLIAVSSPVATAAELHVSNEENGIVRMRPLPDGVEISPQSVTNFITGGKHVMLVDLQTPLGSGEFFDLTLTFEKAGDVPVSVSVLHMPGGDTGIDPSQEDGK